MAKGKHRSAMIHAERDVTVRDYAIFQIKLILDGLKDGALLVISTVAIVLDLISGKGRRPRIFYSVLRASERFDLWLNLNGAMERLEENSDDGLFGVSAAGSDSLLGQIEQLVRGGDRPPRGDGVEEGGKEGSEPGPG